MFAIAGAAIGGLAGAALGTGTAIGAVGGALAGAGVGAAVGSGIGGQRAAQNAADIQAASANQATQTQWRMYKQSRQDQLPWLRAGKRALKHIEGRLSGEIPFEGTPYYKWLQSQGEGAINRLGASRGQYFSGGIGQELMRFNKNLASTDWYDSLRPYQSLAGLGQTQANQMGANALNTGYNIGQNQIAAGNALATGAINQQNAITGGLQGGMNFLGTMSPYLQPQSGGYMSYGGIGGPAPGGNYLSNTYGQGNFFTPTLYPS